VKKWLLFVLLLASVAYATLPNSINPPPTTGASFFSKLLTWINNEIYQERGESCVASNFVVSGCLGTVVSGLTQTPPPCLTYVAGYRELETRSITYPDNSGCNVIFDKDLLGNITGPDGALWIRVPNEHYLIRCSGTVVGGVPLPLVLTPPDTVPLMNVVTVGGSITSVADTRRLNPLALCPASGANPCITGTCQPPTVAIGLNSSCGVICSTDHCNPNPCQHGGLCINQGDTFECVCPCGCTGDLCGMCGATTTTAGPTTTGTGSTTTSTSSTTTTSTLPLFPSTTFLVVPSYPADTDAQDMSAVGNNVMICGRFVPPVGINNATKAAFLLTAGPRENDYVVSIYVDDDAGARVMKCFSSITFNPIQQCTGLPAFSLTAGTPYRVCACRANNFSTADSYLAPRWMASSGWASEQNTFAVSVGRATNPCSFTGGNESPTTTGPIVQDNSLTPPIVLLSRE
jgi:hypothetical protein